MNISTTEFFSKIEFFSKKIKNITFEDLKTLSEQNQTKIALDKSCVSFDNIENLDSGISGYLLLMLELSKNNKHDLNNIVSIADELVEFCKDTSTSNYSLYTGRSGVIYFLMKLYEIKKDKTFLSNSIELIKQCGGAFLDSIYTTDYLYNGRAGTLLVLLMIYENMRSKEILDLIELFKNKILLNSSIDSNGLSWESEEEFNLKNSCGYTHGASGIVFVLKKVNSIFPNNILNACLNESEKYINSCWSEEENNWKNFELNIFNEHVLRQYQKEYGLGNEKIYLSDYNFSWNNGKMGILINKEIGQISLEEIYDSLKKMSLNIYDGLSGIGLCLLKNKSENQLLLTEILNLIIEKLAYSLKGGLFHGEAGAFYFLLKLTSEDHDFITSPSINFKKNELKIHENDLDIRIGFLKNYYPKTISFMEIHTSNTLNRFLSLLSSSMNEDLIKFSSYIIEPLNFKTDQQFYEIIKDVYLFEDGIRQFTYTLTKTKFRAYLESIDYQERILLNLKDSKTTLYSQKVKISGSIQVLQTKWDWTVNNILQYAMYINSDASHFEFILIPTYEKSRIYIYPLEIEQLVLQTFKTQKTVSQAILEIKSYINSLPPNVLNEYVLKLYFKNIEAFLGKIDFLVVEIVKKFLYLKVFELTK